MTYKSAKTPYKWATTAGHAATAPGSQRLNTGTGAAWRIPVTAARWIFLLLGLCPLVGTAGWAAWRHATLQPEQFESWLGARLGLEVKLVDLRHPQPSVQRLGQVELLNPETGGLLARASEVSVQSIAGNVHVDCESVFIPRNRFMTLCGLLHNRAMRERRLLQSPLLISIANVVLSSPSGQTELKDWQLKIERREDGSFATATFTERAPDAKPIELFISRQVRDDSRTTEFDLLTESDVDVTTFLGDEEWLARIGDRLRLRGHLWLQWTDRDWSADFAGRVSGLQLGSILNQRYPHRLHGEATVLVRKLEILGGKIKHLEGQLIAEKGQVSASLLQAASRFLEMTQATDVRSSDLVDFDQLSMLFAVSREGLFLRGACQDGSDGALITAADGPLLIESAVQPLHTFRLIQTLANEQSSRIFWTEACKPLLDLLPPPAE